MDMYEWYEPYPPYDWACSNGQSRYVGQDRNGDGKYKAKGDPDELDESKRPEVWCQNKQSDGTWKNGSCPFATMQTAETECTVNEGSWSRLSPTQACCAFPAGDLAVLIHDDNEDRLIYNTEFHCEGLNENGEPDGQEITCPGEE